MAKKKEDLGGVWRTVGGRRIFIKDGQDLYEAMNDSGKFTNLKKENFKRKKNDLNKGDVFVNKNGVKVEIVDVDEKGNTLRKMIQPDGKEDFKNFNEKDVKAMLSQNGYHKEIEYIGQDNKAHKMLSIEYPEDRDGYHKYLTEKYGTYKEEEIKDKNGKTDYKKLREEFYESQKEKALASKPSIRQQLRGEYTEEESEYLNQRRKEIEFEQKKGIYTGGRETNPDGSYKHQKEFDEYSKKDTLLEKASKIEEIEAELKEVQNRVWEAELEMDAQDEPMTSPAYDEDYHKMQDLRKELEKAKDDYWAEKKKINDKRWEKELNSKPNFERGSKEHYDAMVKSGMSEKDAQHIVDLEKGNKRLEHDSYGGYHTKSNTTQGKIEAVIDQYNNPDRKTATLSDMVKLKIQKDGDRYVIVDETETLGYNGGDKYERRSRERIEKEITEKLRKEFNDEGLYLEPDVPGRLVIASDKKELGGFVVDNPKTSYTSKGSKIIKDHRYYDWVDEVDPNSELTESELEQMYRSIYPNRRKK